MTATDRAGRAGAGRDGRAWTRGRGRGWRGIRERWSGLATLAAMAGIVVAGAVLVVGFADHADASLMLAAPLVLLGLVAVPTIGQELAEARRTEIGVARLRGLQGAPLTRLILTEPALAVAVGSVAGYALGAAGVWLSTRVWLDQAVAWPGWRASAAAVLLAAGTTAAALVGMHRVVRAPLADQVAVQARPRPMTTLAVFGSLLVVVAAAVAAFRAGRDSASDPTWVVLLGPGLVGLAAGQLAVWLLRALTRAAVARSVRGGLPVYLAARRLRGTAGLAGPLRLLVAATVVATVAVAGAARVGQWTDRTARLSAGGPVRVAFDGGALPAYTLTHHLDPEGRWLMAATYVPGAGGGSNRRSFLDTERYDAVVGEALDDATSAPLGARLAELRSGPSVAPAGLAAGDRLTLAAVSAELGGRPGVGLELELDYLGDSGSLRHVTVRAPLGSVSAPRPRSVALPGCAASCAPSALRLSTTAAGGATPPAQVLVSRLEIGHTDLLAAEWVPEEGAAGDARTTPAGILARLEGGGVTVVPARGPLRVLATRGLEWRSSSRVAESPGGVDRPADVVGVLAAAPFVQATGYVADLPAALVGDAPTVAAGQTYVIARADTPRAVLDALAAAGGGEPTSLAAAREDVARTTGAGQARVFGLLAGFCLAIALVSLVASAARLRAAYRSDVAALRLLGIPAGQIRAAGRVETALLGLAALVIGVVGGAGAVHLLLGSLPVVRLPDDAVPLATTTPWWAAAAAGLSGALLLTLVHVAAHRVGDRGTRPALLREGVSE